VSAIYGVYVYSDEHRTYCCELTPSRELTRIGLEWRPISSLPDEQAEALEAELMEHAELGDCVYMHCSAVTSYVQAHPDRQAPVETLSFEEDCPYGEYVDQLLEMWHTGTLSWRLPFPAP
jgi:hypothetical protein